MRSTIQRIDVSQSLGLASTTQHCLRLMWGEGVLRRLWDREGLVRRRSIKRFCTLVTSLKVCLLLRCRIRPLLQILDPICLID